MRANIFKSCIDGEKTTYEGSVILDVTTRWNSTYLMLDTTIKFRKAFERIEEDDPSFAGELNHDLPKDDDWENAIILSEFLKLFYDTTNRMSGSSYITSNDYFEGIALLYKYSKDAVDASNPKLQVMGMKMKEKFDKYYGSLDKVNMLVSIAVVLDPRAKLSYVNFLYGQIYDDESKVNEMHYKVKDALERLYEFYEQSSLASSNRNFGAQSLSASCSGSNANAGGSEGNKIKKYDIQAWRRTFMHSNQQVCNDNKSDLDQYLEDENENILDLDLLMW
ncbi:zinc finger BED domain-containing protein RICESLEEPER 1-like [Syzygium oleosum]|uniref:zinc finger BED domain-containing protein RICESLEEPER 1-like n=1 Tax=Syzygium oleosum TaxID=219896 RepID=UPI0011D1F82B|nr:zinc finger BED domain-containing protein RICESLEEPER 1-like [Syzygium oleosum]